MTISSPRNVSAPPAGRSGPHEPAHPTVRISPGAWWLSAALLLVTDVASGLTAFGGLLSGTAVMNGSAKGTALVLLFVTTPALAGAMFFAARGSVRAVVIWLGALAVTLYNSGLFLYATPFNSLFLLYVAMLGLAVWAIGWLLRVDMIGQVASRTSAEMPVRTIAVYIWVIAVANALIWLQVIVPAVLSADPTAALAGSGLTTNPVWIQDLALSLPLAIVAGVWLWRRRRAGYLVCGAVLTMWILESVSVAVDQWFGHQADPASTVVSLSIIPGFAVLAVLGLVPLLALLRQVRPSAESTPR